MFQAYGFRQFGRKLKREEEGRENEEKENGRRIRSDTEPGKKQEEKEKKSREREIGRKLCLHKSLHGVPHHF